MVPADTTRTIKEEYEILLHELKEYNPELIHKPRVLAVTKSDMLDDELQAEMKKELPDGVPAVFISSVAQRNLDGLKDLLWKEINATVI
jgi:GTP-binding protein